MNKRESMSSNIFPSTGGKPKFNPNAEFEVVQEERVATGKKPKFNPKASFEAVTEEKVVEPTTAAPKSAFQLSQPTFKSAPVGPKVREFSFEKPVDELGAVKLQGKARTAHENLQKELQGNQDVKVKMIKQRRFEDFAKDVEVPRSDMPKTQSQIDAERLMPQAVKPQDLPVTEDDLLKEDEDIIADRGKAVRLLQETMKTKPDKAKEIQKNLYTVDAFNSLGQTPDENVIERVPKIEANAKKIDKGELMYDAMSGRLIKPLGLIGSSLEGWKQKSQLFADYDFLKNTENDAAIALELDSRRKHDPDEPIPVPKGKVSEIVGMLGGTPVKPILGAAIASLAGPKAGMAAGAAIGGREFAKMEFAATFQQVYNELRDQGVEKFEAVREARKQAEQAAEVGAVTGAAMGLIGGRIGMRPLSPANLGTGFKAAAFNVLKSSGSELGKMGLEGLAAGGIGAVGQLYKNKLAQEIGIKRPLDEGVLEQIEGNLLATVAMGAAIKAGRGVAKANYRKLLHGLSKMPDDQINGMLQEKVQSGEITQEAADQTIQRINDYKALDQLIPDNVTEEARFKIQDKITKRNELEQKLETTDKAYHPEIKEKIKAIDEEIVALSKETEKPPKTESGLTKSQEKEAIETAEEFLSEGIFPEIYAQEIQRDPIGFWKTIAQQAQNRDEQWRPLKEPLEESAVREQFGDTVVDYAKELFPAPDLPTSTENVSVIMPGEIKQPETITIKPKEDAIPERSPEAIHVDETPRDSETVVGGIPESGETAIPQEGQPEVQKESHAEGQEKVSEPEMIGITHSEMDKVSRELGLPEYSQDPESFDLWTKEAKDRLAKDPEAINKLINKLRRGEMPDPVETQMMKMHFAALKDKYNNNPTPELLAEINRTKNLYNISGRAEAKSFVARKGLMPVEDSLADFHMRDVEFNQGAPLTEEQLAQSTKEYNEIKAAKDALDEKVMKLQAENAKLKAEKIVKEQSKTKSKSRTDFASERKKIITDIKEKLRKARGETSVVAVPYAKELIAIAPDVVKLAKSYIEQGITELPELVKHIRDAIKEDIPQITDNDVHNIIAGEYNQKKPTRSQLSQQLFDLRTEAKLINDLEALQRGEEPKTERKRIQRNRKIEELRGKIKDLRDEMGLNERTDADKLSALKSRYKKQIAELEDKISKGDYGPDEKPEPLKLDKEAEDLRNKYQELKREREVRLAKEEFENRTNIEKVRDWGIRTLNTPREIMASVDFSAPLRQGLVATVSHPTVAMKAFPEMFRQAFSPKQFDQWLTNLKESPDYKLIEDSGLYVADPNSLHLGAKEEQFMGSLVTDIPILRKTIGAPVKASERAYVSYLNKMRVDIFRQGVELFESQGRTFENSPELYKGLADYINNSTGRGGLGPLNKAAPVLNTAFFSPRLIASRINLLNPYYYVKLPKEVRIMALKDIAKTIAFGVSLLGLAKAAGADVETDPRSPDFGKIRGGNTRWDIWGGFQQYVRIASQIWSGKAKSASGAIRSLDGESFPYKTRLDQLASFFRGKLAPVPGTVVDMLAGKNVVGEEFDPAKKVSELFIPMIAQDINEAWKDQGVKALFTIGLPSAFGVGTTTYKPKPPKKSSKSSKKGLSKSLKKELKK
jgi:hypothetical protein